MKYENERVILHSDINYCYAQIEEMLYPTLKEVPFVVGGDRKQRHGIVLARNMLTKPFNLRTGEPLVDALRKCPSLYIVPPQMKLYQYYTERVKDIYREYSDLVESFGLDEAWIDVTHSQSLFGDGESIAREIQSRVLEEIGLTISIGLSFNKVFAKLASDLIKPSGFVAITRQNYQSVAWQLAVEELLMVGAQTKKKLHSIHIYTIGELANTPVQTLTKLLGKIGALLHSYANGAEYSSVKYMNYKEEAKSIGNSWTTPKDITNHEEASIVLERLANSVACRLREAKLKGNTITLSLRDKKLHTITRQQKNRNHTDMSSEILASALSLLHQHYDFSIALRSIGLSVSALSRSDTFQLNLFEDMVARDKTRKIEITAEDIRSKFGFTSITAASSLLDTQLSALDPKTSHTVFPVSFLK